MTQSRRILIVGPSWVGDMVMAQSLFKAIRAKIPGAIIDVLAPAWSQALLDCMPEVNESLELPFGHGELNLFKRYRFARGLRERAYDQAILLPNSLKSALIPFWAKIPQRTGWLGEMRYGLLNDYRKLDKQQLTRTVTRFVALADLQNLDEIVVEPPALQVNVSDVYQAMQSLGVQKQARKRVVALCPGAEYGPAKQWPHYAALASRLLDQGLDVWLLGSAKDQSVCQTINQATDGRCRDLSGKTTLAQVILMMAVTDAVVSNDSGLMHIAAALNRPLVALYGSSDPGFTPPLNQQHRILSLELDCSPCFKRECPLGHFDCLQKLSPEAVMEALASLQVFSGKERK